MLKYVARRMVYMLLTFAVITCMCFVLIRMLPPIPLPPDDPVSLIVEARREALGYGKPLLVQLGIFAKKVVTEFDWDISDVLYYGSNVADVFFEKLPATMVVNLYAILVSIPLGMAFGVLAALRKDTWLDHVISTVSMVCICAPSYVYAFLVQYFLCAKLGWFDFLIPDGTDWFSIRMLYGMLPAIMSLSFGTVAGFARTTRAELTEALTGDYMLLARAKGLSRLQATLRHGMKNCMVVLLPGILGTFVSILSGSPIIERIFGIPGVGDLTIRAIESRDYPVFMLATCFYTAVGLLAGLVVDLSCGMVDPRIRMGAKK